MKSLSKIIIAVLLLLPFSCDTLNFKDKLSNPNAATEESASADLLFNSMQLSFANMYNSANRFIAQPMRMEAMTWGVDYNAAFGSTTGNTVWSIAYAQIFPDYDAFLAIAEPAELNAHIGAAKVIKAYTLMLLVDLFGDVPYTEAGGGVSNPSPVADDQSALYDTVKTLLDEAISDLDPANVSRGFPGTDLFYGSGDNRAKWAAAANSLLMKWALNKNDMGVFDAAAANAISSNDGDFDFHYGTNRNNPNARHPQYNSQYETSDGVYMSNFYMWNMRGSNGGAEVGTDKDSKDPRIRYYFYRQTDTALGEDQFTIDCPFRPRPTHYAARDPFCLATNIPAGVDPTGNADGAEGYWGRDHGDADGIPPDGQLRTVYGVYPAGGLFDGDTFKNTKKSGTLGGLGQGIWPVMDNYNVHFMMAERALKGGDVAGGRTHMEAGIRASITKVMDFADAVDEADVDPAFVPSSGDIDTYVNEVLANYDAATDPMDVVMKEFHIALWGNAMDAWDAYKRTGYPSGLQPTREPSDAIPFPHMFLYPSIYVDLNQNASQRSFGEMTFWDPGKSLK